eukprot:PLAT9093.1.p1 GENE.PLAT9093.1~~PLAT9093.1.p1  ORF type:complete len:506 (-),score=129.46 PLAT9093.1:40-1557(-)
MSIAGMLNVLLRVASAMLLCNAAVAAMPASLAPDYGLPAAATAANPVLSPSFIADGSVPSIVNVTAYGATGNGQDDDTAAFQAALNAVGGAGGGIVFVPRGTFRLNGNLTMPASTSLVGLYLAPPSHPMLSTHSKPPSDQSVLLIYGHPGTSTGAAVTLQDDCTVRGLVFYYPAQTDTQAPTPYPWALSLIGNNAAVMDVELLNPYQGISAVGAARHYIARVQGQPLLSGLYVDETYDIGRIEDVHWNPWWSHNKALLAWQMSNGVAFTIARSDWEYVFNTFAFAYAVGYRFVQSETGACNGNFLGLGADSIMKAAVLVEASQPYGLLITNGEFTAFCNRDFLPAGFVCPPSRHVVTKQSNSGAVRFANSAFWGPASQVAVVNGSGLVAFDGCQFNQWDASSQGLAAIEVGKAASVSVRGCDFQQKGTQLSLSAGFSRAVFTGNTVVGSVAIHNDGNPAQLAKSSNVGTATEQLTDSSSLPAHHHVILTVAAALLGANVLVAHLW